MPQGVNIDKETVWKNAALGLAMIIAFAVGWWLGGVEIPLVPPIAPPATSTVTPTASSTPSPTAAVTPTSTPTLTPTQTATPTETPTPRPTIDVSTLIYDVYIPLIFQTTP